MRFEARSIVTHKTPHASFPGGRRPEVVLVMERLLELLVRRLGLVPVAVRRRNLVRPNEMPTRSAGGAGQLLIGSLLDLDCALPRADELPAIETIHFG